MNWKEIKEKYPKSIEQILKWRGWLEFVDDEDICLGHYDVEYSMPWHPFKIRDLYDFFDEQKIFIEVVIDRTMKLKFCYGIVNEFTSSLLQYEFTYSDLYRSRMVIEEDAFIEAFKILEEKLK